MVTVRTRVQQLTFLAEKINSRNESQNFIFVEMIILWKISWMITAAHF